MRILTGLLALVAVSGLASAQDDPCPECDPDGGSNPDNTYSSVDVGALHGESKALADSDWATSHSDDEKGFWTWLSLCLSAFLSEWKEMLGVEADADAGVETYASQDGVDLDATVQADDQVCEPLPDDARAALGDDGSCALGFDRSAAGDLDGRTWEAMGDVNARLDEAGVDRRAPVPGETLPSVDADGCLECEAPLPVA